MEMLINTSCKIINAGKTYGYEDIIHAVSNIKSWLPLKAKRVGVCLNHDEKSLFSILALLDTKKTYVPISIDDPTDRVCYILDDCNIDTVITNAECRNKFEFKDVNVIDIDVALSHANTLNHEEGSEEEIAYILYTSGTTGRPKGVAISRTNLRAFLVGIDDRVNFNESSISLYHTANTFDIYFLESVAVLFAGGTVVVANENEYKNVKRLIDLIEQHKVNTIQITPSKLNLLMKYGKESSFLSLVKTIMVGGEPFPNSLLQKLQQKKEQENLKYRILNMYGPTETTIWSSVSDLTDKNEVNVGTPIQNAEVYIVRDKKCILPQNEEGEIFISGDVVSPGYINNQELTNEKFVDIIIDDNKSVRGFLTGDSGLIDDSGILHCFNRIDNQVKINGMRIELEEIEVVMQDYVNNDRCVVAKVDHKDNSELIGFCKCDDIDGLKTYLEEKLPHYMIPNVICYVEEIPYTVSSKVDRKKLVDQYRNGEIIPITRGIKIGDETEDECKLRKIIGVALEDESIEFAFDDKLEEIGVNSISLIDIIVSSEEEFDIEFDENKLVISEYETVNDLLKYIQEKRTESN